MIQLPWKTVWKFLKQLNLELPYDPEIPLLGIYSKEKKIYVHKKICTQMFIAALFIIAKKCKQSKYTLPDDG